MNGVSSALSQLASTGSARQNEGERWCDDCISAADISERIPQRTVRRIIHGEVGAMAPTLALPGVALQYASRSTGALGSERLA